MVSRPLITTVCRWQLKGAVRPDTQGNQGLCSSMSMSMSRSMAGVTTIFELLSDPKHELHSQQGVAA
jgi:hypothetical protein